MLPVEIIKKKRSNQELSENEINFFVRGFVDGKVTDYQMSAFLMAVYFNGMSKKEVWALTSCMLHSGDVVQFSDSKTKVDKHSTGGVGDKTSLIIGPIVACAGVGVPMISGRGLGHTGGTLDKFESIPGFNVFLSVEEFKKQVAELGVCFIGQTKEICPADKKMYALRDVTATVECIPLICASIMSKKLAEGIDGLVLDVKVGAGAFMKNPKDAEKLAKCLIDVAKHGGKKAVALITDMSQPLGCAVGNSLEVVECLEVMRGQGPKDLRELCLQLSAHMIFLGGKSRDLKHAYRLAAEILDSGRALSLFEKIVSRQGGRLNQIPRARNQEVLVASKKGVVTNLDAEKIGMASLKLGAGRVRTDDKIDPSAGIFLHKKIGDSVKKGEPLATLHFNDEKNLSEVKSQTLDAFRISLQKQKTPRLILKIVK